MNKTLFKLGALVLLTIVVSAFAFAQTTFYVNNQTGLDGYNGLSATVTGTPGVGPKLTIANAIAAASASDVISIAYTGVNYGTLLTTAAMTFTSSGGTPVLGNITIGHATTFTGPVALDAAGTLTLTTGAVTNANNITINSGGAIARAAGTLDVAPAFVGTASLTYSGANKTIGPEFPAASTVLSNLTVSSGVVTVNITAQMSGTLTVAGTLALGGNTLTMTNAAAATHTNAGNITSTGSGGLAIIMSGGDVTFTPGVGRLPNLTVSQTGSIARTLVINGPAGIDGDVIENSGAVTLSTPTGATGVTGSIVNNSTKLLTVTLAMTIGGNVTNSSTGVITFGNVNVTVTGNVLNSGAQTNSSNTTQIANAGNINFGDGVIVVSGNLTNSSSFSGTTTGTAANAGGFLACGNITFASTSNTVTVTGLTTNNSTNSFSLTGTSPSATIFSGSGDILFANTTGNLAFTGGMTNSSTGFSFAGTTGCGAIVMSGRLGATVTVGTGAANANLSNNSTNTGGTLNGNIDFTAAATGTVTVSGSLMTDAGAGTGDIILGAGPVTVTGTVTHARTATGAQIQFNGAAAANIALGGISQTGTGSIVLSQTTSTVTITAGGAVAISAGSITASALTSGAVTINGNYTQTGGTFTAASATTSTFSVTGNMSVSAGTFNYGGTANGSGAISITGDVSLTGGTVTLGTNARAFTVTGANATLSASATVTGGATLTFNRGTSSQTFNSAAGVIWPGDLAISNTFPSAPTWTLAGGNLIVSGNVTFNSGGAANGVNLANYTLFVKGTAGTNFTNNSGYTGGSNGFVSMQGGGAQVVAGSASFYNIEVDNAAGATFGTGAALVYTITGAFNLTNGTVSAGVGDAIAFNNATTPPTIVRNQGGFGVAPTFTSTVNVVYIGQTKTFSNEVPTSGTNKLVNLTIATTGAATVTANINFEFSGTLTINTGQTFAIGTQVVTANGASIVSNGSWTSTSGKLVLNRAAGTTISATAGLPQIDVATNSLGNSITGSTGIIVGTTPTLTLLAGGTGNAISVAFTGTGTHITANLVTTDNKNTFTLASSVKVGGNLVHAGGAISLGDYNLTVVGTANSMGGGSTNTITSGTGKLIFLGAANQALTLGAAATIAANFQMNENLLATLLTINGGFDLTLSGGVTLTKGTLTLNTDNLVVTGTAMSIAASADAAVAAVGAETVTFSPASSGTCTVTLGGATTMPATIISGNVTLAGSSGALTLASLTHSGGTIDFAARDLSITGAFSRTATTAAYSATTGALIINGAFTQGTGFTIPNLKFSTTGGTIGNNDFTVTKVFTLNEGGTLDITPVGTTNRLYLGDATNPVTFVRQAGTLDVAPNITAGSTYNLTYNGAAGLTVSTIEWPTTVTVGTLTMNMTAAGTILTSATGTRNVATAVNLTMGVFTTTAAAHLYNLATGVVITRQENATVNFTAGGFTYAGTVDVTYAPLLASAGGDMTAGAELPTSAAVLRNLSLTRSANVANANLTINSAITVNGTLSVKNSLTTGAAGTITALGDVTIASESGTYANATSPTVTLGAGGLVFGGAANQSVSTGGITMPNLTINKSTAAATVTVTGGNLTVSTMLTLTNGVLVTGANNVILGANPGFSRAGVTATNQSHIAGNVQRSIAAIGRFEFPTGSAGTTPQYRPMTITFPTAPIITSTITINHQDAAPGGIVNLPLAGGNNVSIGSASPYYWLATANPALGAGQSVDVELVGTNLNAPFQNVNQLRIIRRFDGSVDVNGWDLQGDGTKYSNIMANPTAADTVVTVRNLASVGSLVTQQARFAIGIPTQKPSFTAVGAAVLANSSVNENATLAFTYIALNPNLNDPTVYSLAVAPALTPSTASINSSTGAMTFTPDYSQAGTYTFTVTGTNGTGSSSTSATVTVVNVNRAPVMTAITAKTASDGQPLTVALASTDADGNTTTYSLISIAPTPSVAPAVSGTNFTWTPAFVDAGIPYTVWVKVADGVTTGAGVVPGVDSTSFVVTVNYAVARGDVNKDGVVTPADAALVLQHVAGLQIITDPAALRAADANGLFGISAYDAALILIAYTTNTPLLASSGVSLGKSEAIEASGSLQWSTPEATVNPEVVRVSLNLSNAANVYSVQLSSRIDASLVSIDGLNAALPEGWDMKWSVVDNELRVAMAGATPLPSGSVASIMVRLKNKESRLSFSTDAMLNENFQSLGAVEIAAVPTVFALEQNYPNPFNPSTTIRYQVANDANVALDIYNLQGQKIRSLVAKEQKAGYYSVAWDGRNEAGQTVSTGLYLYRVQAGSFVATHKMLMIK